MEVTFIPMWLQMLLVLALFFVPYFFVRFYNLPSNKGVEGDDVHEDGAKKSDEDE